MSEERLKEKQNEIDELYKNDIIYKKLVDDYSKARNDKDISEAINALAKYTDELHKKYVLELVKSLNITNEDIRDMICNGIIDYKIMNKILKFKGIIKDDR